MIKAKVVTEMHNSSTVPEYVCWRPLKTTRHRKTGANLTSCIFCDITALSKHPPDVKRPREERSSRGTTSPDLFFTVLCVAVDLNALELLHLWKRQDSASSQWKKKTECKLSAWSALHQFSPPPHSSVLKARTEMELIRTSWSYTN